MSTLEKITLLQQASSFRVKHVRCKETIAISKVSLKIPIIGSFISKQN